MLNRPLLLVTVLATVTATFASTVSAEPSGVEAERPATDVVESETGSYIVVMAEDPVVATVGQENLDTAVAEAIAEDLEEEQDEVLEDIGADGDDKINTYTNSLNGFSALMTHDEAETLAANPRVAVVLPDELLQHDTNASGDYLGLTGPGEAWQSGLTGEDVVIGVIDNGIWPEHPSFADDGSYPSHPIQPLDDVVSPSCDFGNTAHNPVDVPFTCNNKLLGARQMLDTYRALIGATSDEYDSARDDDGHGTHTASTAGGNAGVSARMRGRDLGEISGVAPRARIIAYKGLGALGGFTSDLAAAIDQAVLDGVDVINYSIGGGASLPVGVDDLAFLFAADAGVFVATSAGNSGPGDGTVGSPGNAPWLTTVGASTQHRFYQGWVFTPWGPSIRGASLTPGAARTTFVDAEDAGGDLCIPGTLDPAEVSGTIVLCRRGAIGRVAKSEAVALAGGTGMVLYNNVDEDSLFTDTHLVPTVHINNTDGLRLKEYIDRRQARGRPAEAKIRWTGLRSWAWGSPNMTYFSARGPNGPLPDIIKPDVTAPGHQILAGDAPGVNAFGDSFQAISGTSMSSPHVAGLFALIKQAHPTWSAAAAKSAIMTTADTDVRSEDRRTQATPFEMGAGEIDPGQVAQKGSVFDPGLVYDAGLFDYAAFTCGAELGVFTPGMCTSVEGLGFPSDASDLNMASIGIAELAGTQTVVRTVTNVSDDTVTYRARVRNLAGYDATITPNRFTLAPGESITYEVEFVSTGAPVGEWRFGELELRGGGYRVVSPIALRGAAFDAADVVSGSGSAGSVDVGVTFGYGGSYSAAPHGLVPSTPLSGSIGQDPDRIYPSGDDAPGPAGGVDRFPIPLTGSAFLRISLVIPGPDDLDLLLEDSSGTIVAESINGGSDELIELLLPTDDTYTLVVHGREVTTPPLPYTVDTWSVPITPGGGSLSVASAPTSATPGSTGTVTAEWSGLAPGSYLGAISHTGDAGLLGLTLIGVDA